MSASQRPRLAELRVGIFVVVSCAVLAMAIFAIGSQVGLFQEKFWAMTYLNNVSGLKPGDIVLLNGVEVGNVINVGIGTTGQIPETEHNKRVKREIAELEAISERNRRAAEASIEALSLLQQQLDALNQRQDPDPATRRELERSVAEARRRVNNWDDQIVRDERNLSKAN